MAIHITASLKENLSSCAIDGQGKKLEIKGHHFELLPFLKAAVKQLGLPAVEKFFAGDQVTIDMAKGKYG